MPNIIINVQKQVRSLHLDYTKLITQKEINMSERTNTSKRKSEQKKPQGFSSTFIEMFAAELQSIGAAKRNE